MELVLDASPLIYLAKLDAMDTVSSAGYRCVVPPSAFDEAARPALAFRFPEVSVIVEAREQGVLRVVSLDDDERQLAAAFATRSGGLHPGEPEVLALGRRRRWTTCFHERQAARLARSLGIETVHLVEVLLAGTSDDALLEQRVRHLARLTNLRMADLDALLDMIGRRR